MIKKIGVESLKKGMFIHDLNCSWLDHDFVSNSLKINDDKTIKKIIEIGIRELYIDTEKGVDVSTGVPAEEVKHDLDTAMGRLAANVEGKKAHPIEKEMQKAKALQREADKVISEFMSDAKMGKAPELGKVEEVVSKMVDSIYRNKDALEHLGKIRTKDEYTFKHSLNVCILMVSFCKGMKVSIEDTKLVGVGALLHDVGKMLVPDEILNKPTALTEVEYQTMKEHVIRGEELLRKSEGISEISVAIATQHHERYDGTGYPHGLKNDTITTYGQMASIVDVYDAITADRVYHKGLRSFEGLRKLLEWSNHHFNPTLVQHFIRAVGVYPAGTLVKLESGLLAIVVEQGEKSLSLPVIKIVYDSKKERFITPFKVKLEYPPARMGEDRIIGTEIPERWGIKMEDYAEIY
ncbi:MAG: HD-GYP domain-containing protein [Nitrospinota bacterium]|nr:HD-GYP domain-containing protein [Nitrospinota bacterium]